MTAAERDEIARLLWSTSKDKKLYKTWDDVPENVRAVWHGSFTLFEESLTRIGYEVKKVAP